MSACSQIRIYLHRIYQVQESFRWEIKQGLEIIISVAQKASLVMLMLDTLKLFTNL